MLDRAKQLYVYAFVVGLGILLISLPLSIPVATSDQDFSIFNPSWNGCSSLAVKSYHFGGLEPTFTLRGTGTSLEIVQLPPERWGLDPERDAVVIVGPDLPFTEGEGGLLRQFLLSGGVLLLADDFGQGNSLLQHLGTSTRITGRLALDLSFSKKGEFMMVSDIYHPSTLTENVSFLLLNYPSTLHPSPNATVLARSSPTSWLEISRNEKMDEDEPQGPFPIISVEGVGKGVLIVISDPSLLINQMIEKADNSRFVNNLLSYITSGGRRVLFDEYHRRYTNPVAFSQRVVEVFHGGGTVLLPLLLFAAGGIYVSGGYRKPARLFYRLLERFFGWSGEEMEGEAGDPLEGLEGEERREAEEILKELAQIGVSRRMEDKSEI